MKNANVISQIDLTNVPEHIAIIMDGNGRWAKKQGAERLFGHNFGIESIRSVLNAADKIDVKFLTVYAFSKENWSRPKEEVDGIMDLIVKSIAREVDEFNEKGVKLLCIGDVLDLPIECQNELNAAIESTKNNSKINLVLSLNYSAKWEITEAVRDIAKKTTEGQINLEEINPELVSNHLNTKNIPDPELLIRTGGEKRISNFLLWQIAYSELYFTEILWPDFRGEDLYQAIIDYQQRERRFGKVSEQLK
jgi:undecaprenyl diphosphate synthase